MAYNKPPRRGGNSSQPPRNRDSGGPPRGRSRVPAKVPAGLPRSQETSDRQPPKSMARPKKTGRDQEESGGAERLQKALAHAGLGSRRACEELILQGRVTVDGKIVRELGTKVLRGQSIAVDGQRVLEEKLVYFAVYKPKGYVSTNHDPSGRPRVVDLLPTIPQRVYTVGRLDEMSTGLIILTNDGELANKLTHPKFGVEKLYRAVVAGLPTPETLKKLTDGIWLAEGKVRAKKVRIAGKRGDATILDIVLAEGKNREVRRMLAKLNHKVMTLNRVAVGPVTAKGLSSGQFRSLTGKEVDLLRRVANGEPVPMPWSAKVESREVRPPRRGDARHTTGTSNQNDRPTGSGGGRPNARPPIVGRPGQGPRPGQNSRPGQGRPRPPRDDDGPMMEVSVDQRRPSGTRVPRPTLPPPSQRRAAGGPGGPPPPPPAMDGGPRRRMIGVEGQDRPPRPPSGARHPSGGTSRPQGVHPRPTGGPPRPGGSPPRPGGPPANRPRPENGPPRPQGVPPRPTSGPPRRPPSSSTGQAPRRRIIGGDFSSGGDETSLPRPPLKKPKYPRSSLGARRPPPSRKRPGQGSDDSE